MTDSGPRATVAPAVDPVEIIERQLTQHPSAPGGKCATCGTLPEGMTPVRHRAIAVYNRLAQAGLLRPGVV